MSLPGGLASTAIAATVRGCRLFAEVKPESLDRLVAIARPCTFAKGQLIFRQEEQPPGVYIVGTGLVRVFKTGSGGKEHVLHLVGPGGTFAEVAAIGNFPCPAHAEAVTPTTCVLLPTDRFQQALAESHHLCLEMLTGMSFWVRHLVSLMEDVVLRDAIGRLAQFLLKSQPDAGGTVELPGLKRYLASHLNLTSETFSRTLGRLVESGLVVELDGSHIQIRDPQRLRMIAEGQDPASGRQ
jgi:CRP/FNR family transcriptional regulator